MGLTRIRYWLAAEVIAARVALADRIIARLTKAITTLKGNSLKRRATPQQSSAAARDGGGQTPGTRYASGVRESGIAYGISSSQDAEAVMDKEIEELLRLE